MKIPTDHVHALSRASEAIIPFATMTDAFALRSLGELLVDPAFLSTLSEFHESSEARREAAKDATSYLLRRGVKMPRELRATLVDNNWRISLCIVLSVGVGNFEVGGHYDSQRGWGWGC